MFDITRRLGSLFALCVVLSIQARAQQPLNLDFERLSTEGPTRAWNWTPHAYAGTASILVDSSMAHSGRRSLRIDNASAGTHAVATYLRPPAVIGRTARLSGWIMARDLNGRAYVTMQAWANFEVLRSDSSFAQQGQEEWHEFVVEFPVPIETETLVLTANVHGSGSAWFDDYTLTIDGESVDAIPIARAVDESEIEWLAVQSSALGGVDPGQPGITAALDDLDAIAAIIGDSKVVALGESTHGTSEFFRLKHRILAFLVEKHGFRLFAVEDQQLGMERINEYVKGGAGNTAGDTAGNTAGNTAEDPSGVMRQLFGVWNRAEFRDLILWMRHYNSEHPGDPVEFIGFDMQNPSLPIDSLLAFTRRVDPALHPTLLQLLGDYREAWRRTSYPQYTVSDSVHHRWADGAEAAWRLVEARSIAWLRLAASAADTSAIEWAVQNARVAAQAGRYIFNHQPDRDSSMAANIQWHLDRRPPGTRAVVWAHDSHISKGRAGTPEGNYFLSSMGAYLDRLYGTDYKAFGFMTFDGQYTATQSMWGGPRGLVLVDAFPAPAGSLEEAFHRVAQQMSASTFVTDLRHASPNGPGRLLFEGRPYRFVGYAAEDYGFNGAVELGYQFDGILYVDRTTGATPIGLEPWPR